MEWLHSIRSIGRDAVAHAEAARLLAGVLQFLVLARTMTTADYGRLAILYFVSSLIGPVATARATTLNVKRAARGEEPRVLLPAIMSSASYGVLIALSTCLALGAVGVLPGGVLASGLLFIGEICSGTVLAGIASVYQGLGRYDLFRAWVAVAAATRIIAVGVFLVVGSDTLLSWACCSAASMVLAATAGFGFASRQLGSSCSVSSSPPTSDRYDVPVFALNALTMRVADDLDKAILAWAGSYAAVGVYTVAYRIASYVLFPSRAVLGRFMPAVFREGGEPTPEYGSLLRATHRRLLAVILVSGPLLALAATIMPTLLGHRYQPSVPMAIVLIPLLALRGFHWMYGDLLIAFGRARSRLVAQAISISIPLAVYALLIPSLGAWGAVIGTGVGEALSIVVMRRVFCRMVRRGTQDRRSENPSEPAPVLSPGV